MNKQDNNQNDSITEWILDNEHKREIFVTRLSDLIRKVNDDNKIVDSDK
ncbi:hypothetical protein ACQCVP_15400 [Rossellomorea vietnamensis]